MMRWSRLHGDMQGRTIKGSCLSACNDVRIVAGKVSSEIPCRVSSDLHEWSNDLGAVSTRDPVKL